MPYTPPGHSPAAPPANNRSTSISVRDARSPVTSFSSSVMKSSNPPRSATYLYKNRRTLVTSPQTPPINTQFLPSRPLAQNRHIDSLPNGSIHKSPAPVDGGLMIPTGAIFSPPDSSQNSSDEEEAAATGSGRGRWRDLGNLELQLKEAIKNIPQRRDPSPDPTDPHKSPSPLDPDNKPRRLHQRSASESMLTNFAISQDSCGGCGSGSDDDDEGYRIATPMVRKKSGEVVKSSLKTPNRSRPSSMPSTPTFPKAVHFDSHIEHVRHFLHSEKPSAVSAGSSPVDSYDGETEFPFHGEDDFRLREPPFEWDIALPNFPKEVETRKHLPVRVERVVLSTDKKGLVGTVAVSNIAFQKSVVVRFTLDFWETVSEVSAEFNPDVRKRQKEEGVDRFTFNIKLVDQANLEKKLLFFCVRYTSGGQEFWDNNDSINFQVEFKKKPKPQNGKNGGSRAQLPRSKPSAARPRSMPIDDLEKFDAGIFEKLKNAELPEPKSLNITDTTESLARRANPSGNAFGNRYDFGISLSAAIQAFEVKKTPPRRRTINFDDVDSSYFKSGSPGSPRPAATEEKKVQVLPTPKPASSPSLPRSARGVAKGLAAPHDSPPSPSAVSPKSFNPAPLFGDKPSIESSSYRELLDNYCFYGSAKASSPHLSQGAEIPDKKVHDSASLSTALLSGAVFTEMGSGSPLPEAACPRYSPSPSHHSPPSSLKSSGATSPIQPNFAGFHHHRRPSGAFRFGTPAPTAIC